MLITTPKRIKDILRDIHAEMCVGWSDRDHDTIATFQQAVIDLLVEKKSWGEARKGIDVWHKRRVR